jgi:FixJ family two-component response regulator
MYNAMAKNVVHIFSDVPIVGESLKLFLNSVRQPAEYYCSVGELLAENKLAPAAVFVCILMGWNADELDLAATLWSNHPATPIVVVVASRSMRRQLQSGPFNVVAILDSPCDPAELYLVIREQPAARL